MWAGGNVRTEAGMQDWVNAARQHSEALQEIRGSGPLVSGLMGMDMCCGCCQVDISTRLSAKEVASHPFVTLLPRSAEMDMVADLSPVLKHMIPGDVKGEGSHEWMMTTLPGPHKDDWALEMIGSLIKYPFAVSIFVPLASRLKRNYTAMALVDVLLETGVRAAAALSNQARGRGNARAQMSVLDAQGVCRFLGLPRIFLKLGLLKKLTPKAAEALSHRFRGRIRQHRGKKQTHRHAGKKVCFGASDYVMRHSLERTEQLLKTVRQHGPVPLQEASACVAHLREYQNMLRKLPRSLLLNPDHQGSTRKLAQATGSGAASKYVSTWVQRKHMCSQLGLRTAWPPGTEVDVQWLRSWCPDSRCRLVDYEDSMRLHVLEMKAGCPYHELTMWLCLVGPVMQMHPDIGRFLRDPRNLDECMGMIHEHQAKVGIPPTPELLGKSIWRSMMRKTTLASATGFGAAPKRGLKRPAAALATAKATAEAAMDDLTAAAGEEQEGEEQEAGGVEDGEEAEERQEEKPAALLEGEAEEAEAGEEEEDEGGKEEEAEQEEEAEKEEGEKEEAKERKRKKRRKKQYCNMSGLRRKRRRARGPEGKRREAKESTKRKLRSKGSTGSGGPVAENTEPGLTDRKQGSKGSKQRSKGSTGSGGPVAENTEPGLTQRSKESTGSGDPVEDNIELGLTDSGGLVTLTVPPHLEWEWQEWHDDGISWIRDPRLRPGETARERGWQQCGCNGTCGRRCCPVRQRGYTGGKKQGIRVARIGCPNPVLSETQPKPRCAACVCRARGCEQYCNTSGFCFEHRASPTQVIKRPASNKNKVAVLRRPGRA